MQKNVSLPILQGRETFRFVYDQSQMISFLASAET
jgi:hypothetical protein